MVNNLTEEEQRNTFIMKWEDEDTQLICEVPVFCRSIDLVVYNIHDSTIDAIEFKTKNWKRALEQVLSIAISFDYVEICIQKPRTIKAQETIISQCSSLGVGVYFCDTVSMNYEHVVLPQKTEKIWNVQKSQVIDFIRGEAYAK